MPRTLTSGALRIACICAMILALTGCGTNKGNDVDASVDTSVQATDSVISEGLQDGSDSVSADGDDTIGSDSDALDARDEDSSEVGVDIQTTCPGGPNCPCKIPGDCDNNICLEVPDGHRCGIPCGGGSCPDNYACTLINQSGGGDLLYICVPKWSRICEPCDDSKLCSGALGSEKSACVAYGGVEGSFCGSACGVDADCPGGFVCKDSTSVEGKASKQCVRSPDGLGHIQCPCDSAAQSGKLQTTCSASVVTGGFCPGVRACSASGLSSCTATPAAGETCDGIDNDCNGLTDDVICDDKNPCTDDVCDVANLACKHTPNQATCSDANACTTGDVCAGGLCAGKNVNCDDVNDCTSDSCDKKLGCQHENAAIPCSDDDTCTVADTCIDGECVPGKAVNCDDKNACTADSCDKQTGSCVHAKNSGNSCNDGDLCTSSDVCNAGKCAGTPVDCNDSNVCTNDTCVGTSGCDHTPLATGCDDGNACTLADKCSDGACISGSAKVCGDSNPCTADSCDLVSGACVNKPLNGQACDDGNACTTPDACAKDVCTGAGVVCDDSNSCTLDTCDTTKGCIYTTIEGACSDGNACTLGDTCKSNFCVPGSAKSCEDNNECTLDSCDGGDGTCNHANQKGKSCSDGNACTGPDTCGGGSAIDGSVCAGAGINCDDKNVCTDDSCDNGKGCVNTPNFNPCDDNNACSINDVCFGGPAICFGTPLNGTTACDDGNPCTFDTCDGKVGCTHAPKPNASCDDGNPCTPGDACDSTGKCISGANVCGCNSDSDCAANEDGNLCNGTLICNKVSAPYYCIVDQKTVVNCDKTGDGQCKQTSCNTQTGKCGTVSFTDGTPCNADSSVCTKSDACVAGLCTADTPTSCDDGNPCTNDSCDPNSGCGKAYNVNACTDGNACTIGDICNTGNCLPGNTKNCDDGNGCTNDKCDTVTGNCLHDSAEGNACDADGSNCTPGDSCKNSVCTAGTAIDCNDNKVCTDDSCDPASGNCKNQYNVAGCDDNNPCTLIDGCQGGLCKGGAGPNCDDGSVCTDDSCDVKTGNCVHDGSLHEGSTCDDGSVCTLNDVCTIGVCGGTTKSCDDANLCTTDSCDKTLDCKHTAIADSTTCNDGNACTSNDACVAGACKGILHPCDDGNACTANNCDSSGGCSYPALSDLTTCGGGQWCVGGACKTKGCGDGYVDGSASEQCDDGNAGNCDGCESCVRRSALVLGGSGSYGSSSGTSTSSSGLGIDGDMTVELWVNPTKVNVLQPILTYGVPTTTGNFLQTYGLTIDATGKLNFTHNATAAESAQSTTVLSANVWTHVAAVVSGQQVRLYVNGLPAGTKTLTQKRLNSPLATLAVGLRYPDDPTTAFAGQIDELHIAAAPLYGAAFTPARRATLTAATRGLWHFDEGTGTTAADAAGNAQKTAFPLTLTAATWANDACYGAAATAGVCGDGVVASANGSFPGTEECENSTECGGCQNCRYRKEMTLGGSAYWTTPAFSTWAPDAFCSTCQATMEGWARLDGTDPAATYTLFSASCGTLAAFVSNNQFNLVRAGVSAPITVTSPIISTGSWHHYAIEIGWNLYAPTRAYIDGTLVAEIKPNQFDASGPSVVGNGFGSEIMAVGVTLGVDTTCSKYACLAQGDTIDYNDTCFFGKTQWVGAIDDVRVSQGLRYGNIFVPARRALPDSSTRALWHLDESTGSINDDSGKGVLATTVGLSSINDDCYGASGKSVCGDGSLAPWEWDDGSNKASNFPSSIASVGLTCSPFWNSDCNGISWLSTDANPPALTNAIFTYPTNPLPTSGSTAAPWTWEGWVRLPALPASGKVGTIVAMDSNLSGGACSQSSTQAWAVQTNSDGTDASTVGGTGSSSASKAVWKAGVWQHFALQYHGDSTGSLWVDGQKARDFNVNQTAWNSSCKLHIGGREGVSPTNRISGQLASLHFLQNIVKYGAAFDPSWKLATDVSNTYAFWDFSSVATESLACPSATSDTCARGVKGSGTKVTNAYIDIGTATNWLASGPFCPN